MTEVSETDRLRKLRSRRMGLRVFNGAALGIPLGAAIGAILGGLFAFLLLCRSSERLAEFYGISPANLAEFDSQVGWVGTALGALCGGFGGFCVGTTAAIRDEARGMGLGTAIGTGVGMCAVVPLGDALFRGLWVTGLAGEVQWAMIVSGALGGWILSFVMRKIRARWKWWTRWEE